MEVLDNKEYILGQIKEYSDKEISKLKKEGTSRITDLTKQARAGLKKDLNDLEIKHEKELERIERQTISNFEIKTSRRLLSKRSALYQQVIETLRKTLMKTDSKFLVQKMIKILEKNSHKKIRSFKVPKGCGIKNSDQTLADIRVIGVIGPQEEMEITLDDLLREKQREIQEIIEKEFFA